MQRRPTRVLQTTFFAMLALQTFGSIDSKTRMPPPRAYVAICVLWALLHMLADTGFRQVAARLSILVLLTATVLGPFGKRLIGLLNLVSSRFAIQPPTATTPGATTGTAAPAGGVNVQSV